MNSEVWINGHLLGKRPNGYIGFVYELTPWLRSGKNVIAVRVDNSLQPNSRWYSGSGIDRPVWLEATTPVHVANWGVFVTTPIVDSSQATMVVRTMIDNEGETTAKAELTTIIRDEAGNSSLLPRYRCRSLSGIPPGRGRNSGSGRLPIVAGTSQPVYRLFGYPDWR